MQRHEGLLPIGLAVAFFVVAVLLTFVKSPGPAEPDPGSALDPAVRARFASEPVISLYVVHEGQTRWLSLDEYVMGVVGAETVEGWQQETLAAQAILARTFTVRRLLAPRNACRERYGTDACSDPALMQAYRAAAVDEAIREAVVLTRGMILVFDGQPASTFFSSCAGPTTAAVEEAFPALDAGELPYLQPVNSDCMDLAPDYARSWQLTISRRELAAAAGTPPGPVRVGQAGPSGRPLTVTIGGHDLHMADLRRRLGFNRFRSTYLTAVDDQAGQVTFSGLGWGHGLGMDQWGAESMARAGADYKEITDHYFPGTRLVQLWDTPAPAQSPD